jgi:hypothetical protein
MAGSVQSSPRVRGAGSIDPGCGTAPMASAANAAESEGLSATLRVPVSIVSPPAPHEMNVWVLVMITLVPGIPRDVAEQAPIYVAVFDSYARCASQAAASNSTQPKYLWECKEERVIH